MERKIAIVTGAGSGVGRAVALTLAREGKKLIVVGRSEGNTRETARMAAEYTEVTPVIADVGTAEGAEKYFGAALDQYGRIDILAHCAARFQPAVALAEAGVDLFDDVFRINAKGTFLAMQHALRQMEKQGSGVIVNVSSHDGLFADPLHGIYSASKHAVIGMTKNAAVEYGPKGIRVCAVCPGVIDTKMIADIIDQIPPEVCGPMRRPAQAQEIADAVCYLCSDQASYLNGVILRADGGMGL